MARTKQTVTLGYRKKICEQTDQVRSEPITSPKNCPSDQDSTIMKIDTDEIQAQAKKCQKICSTNTEREQELVDIMYSVFYYDVLLYHQDKTTNSLPRRK
ncbi:hypothetical protein NPIL_224701 [Nephila pilipes]|uniref:Uncharacterized protein n=1 Tax=Nephila pilipes TaxID=299642 RepID=A0A8X6URH1_NEPPI|nr:hypothetical protein NPIL_224701 [Nephila pilipes]